MAASAKGARGTMGGRGPETGTEGGADGMTKREQTILEGLYVWTATLLVAHQIDSAYWQEWNLFGMPGGIQPFVLINVALILPFLYGLVRLVKTPRVGARFALVLAAVGVGAFAIHTWFFVLGRPEFRVPVSIAVLTAALATSLALGWRSLEVLRRPAEPPGR